MSFSRLMPILTIPVLFGLWILAETMVYGLISARIGSLLTFLLFVLKPVAGMLFLGQMLRRKLRTMAAQAPQGQAPQGQAPQGIVFRSFSGAGLAVIGAILVVVPGFLAGLVGLALLTPSVVGRWSEKRPSGLNPSGRPGHIDLDEADWREIETKRLPKRRRTTSDEKQR